MQTTKKDKFDVIGMTCAACVARVEKSVEKINGVKQVNVNLLTNSMDVEFDSNETNIPAIEKAVKKSGYQAYAKIDAKTTESKNATIDFVEKEQQELKMRWWVSLAFLLPLLYIAMGHMFNAPLPSFLTGEENTLVFGMTQLFLTLMIAVVNQKYFQRGFRSLFQLSPNMDSLIAIGSGAAIVYGIYVLYRMAYFMGHGEFMQAGHLTHHLYFESGATILTLITLGKYLEAKSKSKTSNAISKLMNLAPKTALVLRDEDELEVPIENVLVGDIVVVKPGAQIPVDGIVERGSTSVDESALTGESLPVMKQKGDTVMSASINKAGYFTFRASRVGNDTTLSQIVQLVQDASSSKAPISKLADRISAIFVPIVIVIAVLSFIVWSLLGHPFDFALSVAISVLVISCPCALGLATPVAIMVGTGRAAENGILIKSAESFEIADKVDTVVLDKTGTITEGKPKVTDIISFDNLPENDLLQLVAGIEKMSEHPLADAIVEEAVHRELTLSKVTNFQSYSGMGIEATVNNDKYWVGNAKLMTDHSVLLSNSLEVADKLADEGKTPLFVAKNGKLIGIIAAADRPKATSKEAIEQLKSLGLEIVMLTGDHHKTAFAIQRELNISTLIAEVLPQDKDKEITKLQALGKKVAMIGDGINDAPALMRSDLGIAIGAGTDIAIESADVVLMRNDLLDAVTTFRLSKSVVRNIKENLFWAFFYNVLGIPLAAGVFYPLLGWLLSPMFAAAAMSFSSVTVVLNALRLFRFKATKNKEIKYKNSLPINNNMNMKKKTLLIEGMSCMHCSARVEKALQALDGVEEAKVNLAEKKALITLKNDIEDNVIKKAIADAGYELVGIE